VAVAADASLAGLKAKQQVFAHRQLGDDLPALGHVADTHPRPLVGGLGPQVTTIQMDAAAALSQQADDRFQQRRLADAIEADQTGHLAGSHREVHIPQDVALAVIDVEATNGEELLIVAGSHGQGCG
jgi:hypothetical protein